MCLAIINHLRMLNKIRRLSTTFGVTGLLLLLPVSSVMAAAHQDAADFLYQLAEEHRNTGRLSEAAREYREALILKPDHVKARAALNKLESVAANEIKRQEAMETVLDRAVKKADSAHEQEPIPTAIQYDKPSYIAKGKAVRVPDARVNGTKWLYVFGKEGKADYGALPDAQRVYIDVPAASNEPVSVRVIDADTRGHNDEMDGAADTSTTFRLLSGEKELESQSVTPNTPDRTTVTLGPVNASRGEAVGDQRRFCLEAQGGSGNDNNLFALEVRPADAQCFSQQPAVRLAESAGAQMQFYPEVSQGASQVLEEHNYDLDPDGGSAALVPVRRDGQSLKAVPLASSGSGAWSSTSVPVPPGADGTRWKYRIKKGSQIRGNMAFRVNDQQGRALPIYFTRQPGRASAPAAAPQEAVESSGSCNVFTFDGSQSYDPDHDTMNYSWDFGDGTTAEGVRVEHAYAQAGNYHVKLKVKDSTSTACCASETEQVLPVNLPPKPVIEAPERVCSGETVHLSAAKSTDSPGETLSYHWNFGDGTTAEGAEADHVFASGGAHNATLSLDDGRGTACSKAQIAKTIYVNSPPVVMVNGPVSLCASKPAGAMEANFTASGSRDPDGNALTYAWDFGDGTQGAGERVSHAYAQGGRYTAIVTVNDGTGSACSTATATVPVMLNHPPVAYAQPASTGCPDTLATFNGSNSSDADGQPLTYSWDFGDGHTASGATVQHAYATSGAHRARLTVTDNSGMACSASTTEVPVSINAPPVAKMTISGGRSPSPAR